MSLKIDDLGLESTLRQTLAQVRQGELVLATEIFGSYYFLALLPLIELKRVGQAEVLSLFGALVAVEIYQFTVPLPIGGLDVLNFNTGGSPKIAFLNVQNERKVLSVDLLRYELDEAGLVRVFAQVLSSPAADWEFSIKPLTVGQLVEGE